MISILRSAISKIDSLEQYYRMVIKSISKEISDGLAKNELGYTADIYFASLFEDDEQIDDEMEKIREEVSNEYEILNLDNIIEKKEEKRVLYRIKHPDELAKKGIETDIQKAASEFRKYVNMPVIHGSSTLIMLITYFEEFIASLLNRIFKTFPQKYLDKQQVTYSDICNCSIEEVEGRIIAREIDRKMRESYMEWFKLFGDHGIKMERCQMDMKALREIYSRRNIIVHNSGRVNSIYLSEVPDSDAGIGDMLHVDLEYLDNAFTTIKTIVFCIMIEATKLLNKDKRSEYIESVFNFAFEKLSNKEYCLCRKVFAEIEQRPEADAITKCMSKVNYWISENEMGNGEDIRSEIEAFDVSALNEQFALAKVTLLGDYDCAITIIENLFPNSIGMHELENWPLFINLRNSEQYLLFKQKHPEEFNNASIEINKQSCEEDETVIKMLEEES